MFQEKLVGPMIVHGLDDRFDISPRLGDASPVVVVAPNQITLTVVLHEVSLFRLVVIIANASSQPKEVLS